MNIEKLLTQRDFVNNHIHLLPKSVIKNYNTSFNIEYAHNSTAIEGNTLSLMETKVILEDRLSISGKDLQEIFEVVNHNNAFDYIKACISEKMPLNEDNVKEIHAILMNNIIVGGIYRNVDVYISGAEHTPPPFQQSYIEVKDFYKKLYEQNYNPIELAAWTHAEFVRIHPFIDGNGRTSRLIMNYRLMENGFLPISIKKESRFEYFKTLDEYAMRGNIEPFANMISELAYERLEWYASAIKNLM